ncbi:hypothetical protein [Streptomyces sp. NPDC057910]|uniref:COG1470 family protein n=1 Tax=Streptomyces sp. NPDC057910 TaxID=3346278 RepID=UPI0036EA9536
MGVVASLGEQTTEVEPGDSASCAVKLVNDGLVVDRFHLDVLGEAKDWAKVTPAEVRVFPGEVATADIVFSPPRKADIRPGRTGYALRVMSQEDTDRSTVIEGTVQVGGYHQVETELLSRALRGSRSARGRLAVDNLGNASVTVRLTGRDDEGKLRFRFPQPTVTVDGGTTRVVPYRLRPRSGFLRGEARTYVYRIQAKGDGFTSEAAGSLVQPCLMAPWLPKALMLSAAVAAVALVVFPTYFRPEVTSLLGKNVAEVQSDGAKGPAPSTTMTSSPTGSDTSGKQSDGTAGQGQLENDGGAKGKGAGNGAVPSGSKASSGAAAKGPGGKDLKASPPTLADVTSTNLRLEADSKPQKLGTYSIGANKAVPKGQILALSDLLIENLADDKGSIQLRRDDEVLYEFSLKDSKKEWHWTEPLTFSEGQKIVLAVNCTNTTKNCALAAAFSGRIFTLAP